MPPPPGRRGGKFSKPTRGGGKHFSRDLQPLGKDGTPMGMWRESGEKPESEEESSEEETSEEESEEEAGPSTTLGSNGADLTREQRKELARKKKLAAIAKKNKKVAEVGDMPTSSEEDEDDEDDDDELLANPNHSSKARAQARAPVVAPEEPAQASKKEKDNLSRREREALEKEQARLRYQKLHAEGKTDEARADLARLKLIRQQRDEAAARKKAEQEERDEDAKKRQDEIDTREAKLRAAALGDAGRGAKKTRGKK